MNLRDYIDSARDQKKPLAQFTETDIAIATSPRMSEHEASKAIRCWPRTVGLARRKYANPRLVELMLDEYGVSRSTISSIFKRRNWSHL